MAKYGGAIDKYDLRRDEIFNPVEQKRLSISLRGAVAGIRGRQAQMRALDYGCGTGNLTGHLIGLGFNVAAADISESFLKIVQGKYSASGRLERILKIGENGTSAIEGNSFDFTGVYSVLHHIPDYLSCLKELARLTRCGGIIYIDHEQNDFFWRKDSRYLEFQRRALTPSLKKWKKYLNPAKYIGKAREILFPRWQPEGDIHIYPEDHIEWGKIESLLGRCGCETVLKEDYLLYKGGYRFKVYQEYKEKGLTDMRVLAARKNV